MIEHHTLAERTRHIEQDGLFGTWEWDFASGAITWSDGVFRLLGFEPGSVTPSYRLFLECMHPEDRFGYELSGYDAVLEGRTIESEFRIVRPDGTIRWLANKGEIFRDASGEPCHAAGALIDITERRDAEEALRASEERYRALVKATAVVEWRSTPDGFTVEVTNWSALTGQSEEEFKGVGWMDAIHPADVERVRSERQPAIQAGHAYENCFRIRHTDGSYHWVLARAVPLKHSDGTVREWVGMLMDVHRVRSAEERLRVSEVHLGAALQAGRVIAWEYDLSGPVVARSENAAQIAGLGSTAPDEVWDRIHPDDVARVRAAWNAAIEHDVPYDVEFRFFRPDGRMIWLAVKGSVLRNLSTLGDRFVGIAFDITGQKDAAQGGSGARSEKPELRSRGDGSPADSVTFEPTRLAVLGGGEDACLVRVEQCLAAVLARFDHTVGGEHESGWYLEIGFGPWNREGLVFANKDEAEGWFRIRLPDDWTGN